MPATSGSMPAIATTARRALRISRTRRNGSTTSEVKYRVLDSSHGVTVEKVEPLIYRVSYQGKSVVFALNDLSQVKPPAGALGPDEKFIGPIFDESAIRFFLVFNPKLKIFHYVLDETEAVADAVLLAEAEPTASWSASAPDLPSTGITG